MCRLGHRKISKPGTQRLLSRRSYSITTIRPPSASGVIRGGRDVPRATRRASASVQCSCYGKSTSIATADEAVGQQHKQKGYCLSTS